MAAGGYTQISFEVPGALAALDLAQQLRAHGAEVVHEVAGTSLVTTDEPALPDDLGDILHSAAAWAVGWHIPSIAVRMRGRVYELRSPLLGQADATPEEIDELLSLPLELD